MTCRGHLYKIRKILILKCIKGSICTWAKAIKSLMVINIFDFSKYPQIWVYLKTWEFRNRYEEVPPHNVCVSLPRILWKNTVSIKTTMLKDGRGKKKSCPLLKVWLHRLRKPSRWTDVQTDRRGLIKLQWTARDWNLTVTVILHRISMVCFHPLFLPWSCSVLILGILFLNS